MDVITSPAILTLLIFLAVAFFIGAAILIGWVAGLVK
jgi:hypothetical protein